MAEKLKETVAIISQKIRAIRELLSQKPPLKKALEEFIREFEEMELNNQVLILQAFETESTVRSFLVTSGAIQVKLINKVLARIKKKQKY